MRIKNPYKNYRDYCTATLCNPNMLHMRLEYALKGLEDIEK